MISYKQQALDDRWDAIVIGSGIGGLTTAALLSKYASRKVLVLERHYTAGGYTHSFRRPGYSWDVGVHYVGDLQDPASPLRAAFDHLTGGKLEGAPMPDVYDRVLIGGRTFDFPTGVERLRARLKDYFPSEGAAIDGYLAAVQSAEKWSRLYFAEKAISREIQSSSPSSPPSGATTACLPRKAVSEFTPSLPATISTAPAIPSEGRRASGKPSLH